MTPDTLFLRFEGPMQAWGTHESKFVIRRTAGIPSKSGVIGVLCAALGLHRPHAGDAWLQKLTGLQMGVRVDLPGIRWWDYHTVGARMQMRIAEARNKTKPGALLTRREYLCDASFLVALRGEPDLIEQLRQAMENPQWTLYLGRKCCPPSRPMLERHTDAFPDLDAALRAVPWRKRYAHSPVPQTLDSFVEWRASASQPEAPLDALVVYDVPVSFDPPAHHPRFVTKKTFSVGRDGEVQVHDAPAQARPRKPSRPRADYTNSHYRKAREERLDKDQGLCVFCKAPATTVQHVTYRRAGGNETLEDLRALCRLCHDAVTMLEYGHGMGLDRINPEDLQWREKIIAKREEIIEFRSLETRRRHLNAREEVD